MYAAPHALRKAHTLHATTLSLRANLVSFRFQRRRGGIGRRAGLKIQWPQGRVGSSPSAGNDFCYSMFDVER